MPNCCGSLSSNGLGAVGRFLILLTQFYESWRMEDYVEAAFPGCHMDHLEEKELLLL